MTFNDIPSIVASKKHHIYHRLCIFFFVLRSVLPIPVHISSHQFTQGPGETVFQEGCKAEDLFIILSGADGMGFTDLPPTTREGNDQWKLSVSWGFFTMKIHGGFVNQQLGLKQLDNWDVLGYNQNNSVY